MLVKYLKDLLFPIFCVKCGQEGEWLCDECLAREQLKLIKKCPSCEVSNNGELCSACKNTCPLDGALSFFEYKDELILTKLIADFKYNYTRDLLSLWKKIIGNNFFDVLGLIRDHQEWSIIPVPLYKKRERERGYNQSELIADIIAEKIFAETGNKNFVLKNKLIRQRPTAQQAKLNKIERAKNVFGAFDWRADKLSENILLVDDVFTTGATLFECAKVLKQNGAKKIWAITLARII